MDNWFYWNIINLAALYLVDLQKRMKLET